MNADDVVGVRTDLASVWGLLLENDTLHDFLSGLATQAAEDAQGELSCGVTVRRGPRQLITFGSSDEFANRLDEIQYTVDTGPCLESLRTARVVEVDDATEESRWRPYIDRAVGEGVRASLSAPVTDGSSSFGALNLYARRPRTFTPGDRETAEHFASMAAGALQVALRLADRAALAAHLRQAMRSRQVIDQALGIVMVQHRCNSGEAFTRLRRVSQTTNVKLRDVAANLITTATGHPPGEPPDFQ